MNNQKGGQTSFGSSANVWGQTAAKNAVNAQSANIPGSQIQGHSSSILTSAQKQQLTTTSIARRKVIEAYKSQTQNYHQPAQNQPQAYSQAPQQTQMQQAQSQQQRAHIKAEDWQKYHAAWQEYYQKYYGEYYGRAAKNYVVQERLKIEREIAAREAKEKLKAEKERDLISSSAKSDEERARDEQIQNDFKAKIQKKVAKRAKKMRKSRHFVPITIGVSVLILGLLFQYNQVIIANAVAFMSPGGSEVNDITAIDPTVSANVHDKPTLMIPKLNVEVPVIFGSKNDLQSMANAMTNGVAHFAIRGAAAKPGQIGNFMISGHSAGNVYQQSDYKFIFSGLTRMAAGDLIYMDYNSQRYTYRVTGTKTVEPTDTGSLRKIASDNAGKPMITLITCTPLGTSRYRLLVYGEQIHPSYDESKVPDESNVKDSGEEQTMPKNDDSPLEQFWKWLTGQE